MKVIGVSGTCPCSSSPGELGTCAIGGDGVLYCWGFPAPGAIAYESARPTAVSTTAPALQVSTSTTPWQSTSAGTTCFDDDASTVWCWGDSGADQLQMNSTTTVSPTKLPLPGSAVLSVVVGGDHVCDMLADMMYCWGADQDDQLDDGTDDALDPAGRMLPFTTSVVALGQSHTCIGSAGLVKCWGANESGELGNNSTAKTMGTLATVVVEASTGDATLEDVIALSAGASFTCALSGSASGADAYCWGADNAGQLGSGTTMVTSASPVAVPAQLTKIASGTATTCAIDVDKDVWCWGANQSGQAGVGPVTAMMLPATAPPTKTSVTDAIAIAVGDNHACAMQETGAIVCWGGNTAGQLGDGKTSHMNAACGNNHDCSWDPVVVVMP